MPEVAPEKERIWLKVVDAMIMKRIMALVRAVSRKVARMTDQLKQR